MCVVVRCVLIGVNSPHLFLGTLRTPLLDRNPGRCAARPHWGWTRGRTSDIEGQWWCVTSHLRFRLVVLS